MQNTACPALQTEGGYTVTSPLLPELVTEGNSVAEALENVKDAFVAVLRIISGVRTFIARRLPKHIKLLNQPRSVTT